MRFDKYGSSIVSEIGRSLEKATFVVADTDIRALKKRPGIKYSLMIHLAVSWSAADYWRNIFAAMTQAPAPKSATTSLPGW